MASVACLSDREGSELAKEAPENRWGWEPDWSGWRSEWRCGNGCGDSLFQKTGLHGRSQALHVVEECGEEEACIF